MTYIGKVGELVLPRTYCINVGRIEINLHAFEYYGEMNGQLHAVAT
jgi:hypothetical protein